jgi:hypothetical protein
MSKYALIRAALSTYRDEPLLLPLGNTADTNTANTDTVTVTDSKTKTDTSTSTSASANSRVAFVEQRALPIEMMQCFDNNNSNTALLMNPFVFDLVVRVAADVVPSVKIYGIQTMEVWLGRTKAIFEGSTATDVQKTSMAEILLPRAPALATALMEDWRHPSRTVNHVVSAVYGMLIACVSAAHAQVQARFQIRSQTMNNAAPTPLSPSADVDADGIHSGIWAPYVSLALRQPLQHRSRYQSLGYLLRQVGTTELLNGNFTVVGELIEALQMRDIAAAATNLLVSILKGLLSTTSSSSSFSPSSSSRKGKGKGREEREGKSEKNTKNTEEGEPSGQKKTEAIVHTDTDANANTNADADANPFKVGGVAALRSIWDAGIVRSLCSTDSTRQRNTVAYALPELLLFDSECAPHLIDLIRLTPLLPAEQRLQGIVYVALHARLQSLRGGQVAVFQGSVEPAMDTDSQVQGEAGNKPAVFVRSEEDLPMLGFKGPATNAFGTQASVLRRISQCGPLKARELYWACMSDDDDLRLAGLTVLTTFRAKTSVPTPQEMHMLTVTAIYSLKSPVPDQRHRMVRLMKNILTKLRDVLRTAQKALEKEDKRHERHKRENSVETYVPAATLAELQTSVATAKAFFDWFNTALLASLYPGAPFEREVLALELLHVLVDTVYTSSGAELVTGRDVSVCATPNMIAGPSPATYFDPTQRCSNTLVVSILNVFLSSWDRSRRLAADLLLKVRSARHATLRYFALLSLFLVVMIVFVLFVLFFLFVLLPFASPLRLLFPTYDLVGIAPSKARCLENKIKWELCCIIKLRP